MEKIQFTFRNTVNTVYILKIHINYHYFCGSTHILFISCPPPMWLCPQCGSHILKMKTNVLISMYCRLYTDLLQL